MGLGLAAMLDLIALLRQNRLKCLHRFRASNPDISLTALPASVRSWADLAVVEACATRRLTACGDGFTVWHVWGSGRPVVLLHGGSGSWTHWVRNISALVEAGYMVHVPDLPGFGDSAALPHGTDADAVPKWIELGLTKLIGTSACDVIAFSFGSLVGAFLASNFPLRVGQLVLVGSPALTTVEGPALDLRAWKNLQEPDRSEAIRYNLRSLMLSRDESIDDLAVEVHAANLQRDRMRQRRLFKTDVLLRTLPSLRCDVAAIWGCDDALYRDRLDVLCPALSQAPRFRYLSLIGQAGHWVQFEQSARFDDALLSILRKNGDR